MVRYRIDEYDFFMIEDIDGEWIKYEDYEREESAMCEAKSNAVLGEEAMTTTTFTQKEECIHIGWYHTVKFLCFRKRFLACEKCGELIPKGKWGFFA